MKDSKGRMICAARIGDTIVTAEAIAILRHIFDARIDRAGRDDYVAWTTARDVVEYALANNIECLSQFDYLETQDEIIEKYTRNT